MPTRLLARSKKKSPPPQRSSIAPKVTKTNTKKAATLSAEPNRPLVVNTSWSSISCERQRAMRERTLDPLSEHSVSEEDEHDHDQRDADHAPRRFQHQHDQLTMAGDLIEI